MVPITPPVECVSYGAGPGYVNSQTTRNTFNKLVIKSKNMISMGKKSIWIASAYNEKSKEADLEKISSVSSCFGCEDTCSSK